LGGGQNFTIGIYQCEPVVLKGVAFIGKLPQVAEFNTPRSMGAAGEFSAYDEFKACRIA
jgi:hypothetical protein